MDNYSENCEKLGLILSSEFSYTAYFIHISMLFSSSWFPLLNIYAIYVMYAFEYAGH